MTEDSQLSPVEGIKADSRYLRGAIREELENAELDHFGKDAVQLLKHHGTYQQDDRDQRQAARASGKSSKAYMMMIRTRIPGGVLSSEQLLGELDICDELGNGTLRLTTRQTLQLHGIMKHDLRDVMQRLHRLELTTLAACGDVARNVMCCPAPFHSPLYQEVQQLTQELSRHLTPQTRGYHEIWLQDPDSGERERVDSGPAEQIEPLYGKAYLPRKFKVAVGLCHDNCVDLYTHDLGFLAVVRDEGILGYNVLVGGGQGVTPSNKKTFPALAKRMAFVAADEVLDVARAVVGVQRDHGDRSDRKVARLKYLIHRWGIDRFKSEVESYLGRRMLEPMDDEVAGFDDHMGWHEQGDGKLFYGLNIENGRLADTENCRLKTAIRTICRRIQPGIRLTTHQSLLFTDVPPGRRAELESILHEHGVPLSEEISLVRRWSMACVAWPTCGLAITESERALPGVMDRLEAEIAKLGLTREAFTVRMTGCPNGCARPYNSDIGLVGKARNKYTIFIGGQLLGKRLNFIHKDLVPLDEIVPTLVPLFAFFKQARQDGETFGDFCHRQGNERLLECHAREGG